MRWTFDPAPTILDTRGDSASRANETLRYAVITAMVLDSVVCAPGSP
jgi:hypothetical protein